MRNWYYSYPEFNAQNRRWKGDDKKSAEEGIQQAGAGVSAATKITPQEESQYKSSFEIGDILRQISQYQAGIGQAPSGYYTPETQFTRDAGPLQQAYYQQALRGTQDPYGAYESQLQPSLQLAQDTINRNAQQRGLLRSGIPIEQMGRAGVDLAIKEAQDRMAFRNQELARGGELTSYFNQLQQQKYGNLSNLYAQQQGYGQQAMGRQAQGATQAAQYQAYPYQAQLGNYYGSQGNMGAGIGGALGTLGGVAAAGMIPFTGGLSAGIPLLLGGGAIGGMAGSQLGRSIF